LEGLLCDARFIITMEVGLLGMHRTLLQNLDRIARQANTTTSEGLHHVLIGTQSHLYGLSNCSFPC
jgi:uncharacterized membrane protein